ncbi:MAG: hypothetical protein ACTHMQ_13615 [Protaetiibacter sp.]
MEHSESDVEDTVVVQRHDDDDAERTIVRPRRRRAVDVEDTVVVDRAAASEDTVAVDRSSTGEDTIVVDRRPRLLGIDDDDDDDTDRSASRPPLDADDDTDRTVARPRDESDDETISVDRSAPSIKLPPVPSLRRARVQRRRGIAPPPVPVGFAPPARNAVGPGAVEHYAPRGLVPPPPAPKVLPPGDAVPARGIDRSLPSVARRSRRTGAVALAAFIGACLLSATGLTLILIWLL